MDEYEAKIVDLASRTWDTIGFDVLQASGIPSTSGQCLSKETVVEVVLGNIRCLWPGIDFSVFDSLSYDDKIALVGRAFTDEEYGY